MAKREADRVKEWQKRVIESDKVYKKWDEQYRTDQLEDFYYGIGHWKTSEQGGEADMRYTINLFYSTIETRLPTMMYFNPAVIIEPRPGRANDPGSMADERAKLLEDTANTLISAEDVGFFDATNLAIRESFFRFGIVEVGYTADWVDNPDAGKPILKEDSDDPMEDDEGPIMAPEKVIGKGGESVYCRWIPAHQFRSSVRSDNIMRRNDWLGYSEWVYKEDLKKHPVWGKKVVGMRSTGMMRGEDEKGLTEEEREAKAGMIKIWKIWDLRAKVRKIFPDTGDVFFEENKPFDNLPLSMLGFHPIFGELLPLPPSYNWVSAQRELNEIREMQRVHRKRATRRYLVRSGVLEQTEIDKLEGGGDGVYAISADIDAIKPVPDAPLDRAITINAGPQAKEDFREVSGIGGEQRSVAEAETATQAGIIDVNAKVREGFSRATVERFLSSVVKNILLTLRDNASLPFWIKTNVDKTSPFAAQEVLSVFGAWKQIQASTLGDFDFDVKVDLAENAFVNEDLKRNQWTQVLGMLANPGLLLVLTNSEVILKRTLAFYGIRSSRDIEEFKAAAGQVLGLMQQGAATPPKPSDTGATPPGPAPVAGGAAPGPTPDIAGILEQLAKQLPVGRMS